MEIKEELLQEIIAHLKGEASIGVTRLINEIEATMVPPKTRPILPDRKTEEVP